MAYDVLLTNDAVRDLEELYDYIARHDTPEKADDVLTRIEEAFSSLSEIPDRGTYPREKSIP
ncbi:MAG: type II toxin-antitoxin system RelE/ParE family toxin [Desulfuromonadales bacterium]|nr:type II toxin-antitoxin system RelE/ParE family toxin [Chloroflexota bacterium]MCK4621179.1 type II toxin-antitoxin system RelE/ParE family toxin [Desulfuromonadales bacterium]